MTPTREEWRPIPDWEGYYEVSDQGRVRAVARVCHDTIGRHRHLRERPLKPYRLNGGRRAVKLQVLDRMRNVPVSTLVLEAFVGPRPLGMQVCHNDGNEMNDQLTNLRWDTPSENALDRRRHGTNAMLRRTCCPYGHRLTRPNLVRSGLPNRQCLACSRARGNAQRQRRAGLQPDSHQAVSDYHYARIMRWANADRCSASRA